jgi:hypothetical protein
LLNFLMGVRAFMLMDVRCSFKFNFTENAVVFT